MADNVIDSLVIKLGLDVEELKRGITEAKTQLATVDQQISQTQAKTSEATSDSLKGVSDTAKNAKKGTDEATKGLGQLLSGADRLNSAITRLDTSVMGKMKAFAQTVVAPVAGVLAIGGAIQNYIGGVAEVARLTGQYSQKLEEWRYKQQLLSRVTKDEIELYIKGQRALKAFRLTMYDLVSYGMRAAVPYIEKVSSLFEKSVNYIKENGPDLSRFFKVLAGVITVALIPAFIKLAAAIWANPLTWLIATLIAAALVLDDFIVYLHGGKTAFGDLWAKLGDGPTLLKQINGFFKDAKDKLEELGPIILRVGIAFAIFKVATTIVNGLSLAVKALRIALLTNPITAILVGIGAAIMWLYDRWEKAGGNWGKFVDLIKEDFSNLWDSIKNFASLIAGTVRDIFTGVQNELARFFESVLKTVFGEEIGGAIWDFISGAGKKLREKLGLDDDPTNGGTINPDTDAPIVPDSETEAAYAKAGKTSTSDDVTFGMPLENMLLTSGFGKRNSPTGGASSYHKGIDLRASVGTPVYAAADGVVDRLSASPKGNGGIWVVLKHANGYESKYLHLSKLAVRRGQKVNRGQLIAYSGNTGIGTAAHLDFRIFKNGKAVDPLSILGAIPKKGGGYAGASSASSASYPSGSEASHPSNAIAQFTPDSFGTSYQDYVNRLSNGVIDTVNYMKITSGAGISSRPVPVNSQAISNIQNSNRAGNVINRNGDINVTVNTNSSRPGDIANQTANRVSQADATALVHAVDSGQRT